MASIIGGNTLGIAPNVNIFNIHYNYSWAIKWKHLLYDYIIEFVNERKIQQYAILVLQLGHQK